MVFFLSAILTANEGERVCIGDWNDIISKYDKKRDRAFKNKSKMRDFMNEVGAMDLGFFGPRFTWLGSGERSSRICQILDRVISSDGCFTAFWKTIVP